LKEAVFAREKALKQKISALKRIEAKPVAASDRSQVYSSAQMRRRSIRLNSKESCQLRTEMEDFEHDQRLQAASKAILKDSAKLARKQEISRIARQRKQEQQRSLDHLVQQLKAARDSEFRVLTKSTPLDPARNQTPSLKLQLPPNRAEGAASCLKEVRAA
jgi:hypothetical protein